MKNRRTNPTSEQKIRTPHEQLAIEAAKWDKRQITPADFTDAPEAILNVSQSVAISLRMPNQLLELLKRFAKREGIGYQVLIKRWLDDRLRAEFDRIKREKTSNLSEYARQPRQRTKGHAPGFPLMDCADTNGPHYTPGEH
jgi:predicted DNA binding CopG/RHH family protein